MAGAGVDGFIVPRADEWQGEFVAAYAERLAWLTGFTGSAGLAVVLVDKAAVMSDGRYTIQMAQQVDQALYETVDITQVKLQDWLGEHAGVEHVIGYDSRLHSAAQIDALKERGLTLRPVVNLVDQVWADQPAAPAAPVQAFPEEVAGMSAADKCAMVAQTLQDNALEAMVLTLPDSLCWLLNVRGGDTDYIPQVLSYAVIHQDSRVTWFIDSARVPSEARFDRLEIVSPEKMESFLGGLKGRVGLDFKRSPDWFRGALHAVELVDLTDPCIAPKARKTPQEQAAIKQAHIKDGAAMVRFLAWLAEGDRGDEIAVSDKLEEFRRMDADYKGQSFPSISGFGPNGAIVHYRATPKTSAALEEGSLYLIDSGGQYHFGTTDITRTVAIGEPTQEMRENFTRVLQGHIAVALAEFEPGTLGRQIDALARKPLQEVGLDFAHGTGHGVGCYLAVHEEAANLSPRGENALEAGMLLSNEPGYYKEGAYGIRIENLVLVVEKGDHLGFETVSFAPIDRVLIVAEMLSDSERTWLNDYHAAVFEKVSPHLDGADLAWLEAKTQVL